MLRELTTGLDNFNIPITEIVPDKVIQLLNGNAQFILIFSFHTYLTLKIHRMRRKNNFYQHFIFYLSTGYSHTLSTLFFVFLHNVDKIIWTKP